MEISRKAIGPIRALAGVLCVVSCLRAPAWAQNEVLASLDPGKAIHQYVHQVWQDAQGLPTYAINDIVQTSDGYLWLGTLGGAVRFDGVVFKVFNRENTPDLVNSYISSLHEDRDGILWIGSRGSGLLRYEKGRVPHLRAADGFPEDSVLTIAEDVAGGLWIGTTNGLVRYEKGRFIRFDAEERTLGNSVTALAASRRGGVWVFTHQGGLGHFHDGTWTPYEVTEAPGWGYVSLLEDMSGQLWVGFSEGRLRRFDGDRWTHYPDWGSIRVIFQDRFGTIWAGSNIGLLRLAEDSYTSFTQGDGLSDQRVLSLYEDREGSLWIGTYNGALNRLKNGNLTTFTERDGVIGNTVHAFHEDADGNLWIATSQGLVRHKDGQYSSFTNRDGLRDNFILAIHEDRHHNLWIGTRTGGIHLYDGQRIRAVDLARGSRITSLYEDRAGVMWIGTGHGIHRIENGIDTVLKDEGLPQSPVTVVHENHAGILWVGTETGLARLEAGGFKTVDGLTDVWVRAFFEDADGTLWIGTFGQGLYRLRMGELFQYTITNGLPDDYIWDILEDDDGRLWMSSDQGIFVVSKADLEAYSLNQIDKLDSRRYGQDDGMVSAEGVGFVHPGAIKTRRGQLWFPTVIGAVRVEPRQLERNTLAPPLAIESVLVNEQSVDIPERGLLKLSPRQRDIEIHYTALSLRSPSKVKFKYRLEGYDQNWIDAGVRRTAFYTNLPAGRFTFHITAANEDDVWNETGSSIVYARHQRRHQPDEPPLKRRARVLSHRACGQRDRADFVKRSDRQSTGDGPVPARRKEHQGFYSV